MRLKGDGNGLAAIGPGAAHYFAQDVLVAAMDAVKVADAGNGRSKIGGHFLQRAEDSHAISNSSFNPSCARRTCSGRVLLVSWWGRSWEICVKKARRGLSSSTRPRELATVECVGCGR